MVTILCARNTTKVIRSRNWRDEKQSGLTSTFERNIILKITFLPSKLLVRLNHCFSPFIVLEMIFLITHYSQLSSNYYIAGYFQGVYISRNENFHENCTRKVTTPGTVRGCGFLLIQRITAVLKFTKYTLLENIPLYSMSCQIMLYFWVFSLNFSNFNKITKKFIVINC